MNEDDDLIQAEEVRGVKDEGGGDAPVTMDMVDSGFLDDDPEPKPKATEPAAKTEPEAKPKETAAERRERAALEAELRAAKEEVEYWRTQGPKRAEPEEPKQKPMAAAAPRDQMTVDQQLDLLVRDPAAYFKQAGMVTQEEAERIAEAKAEERAAALLDKQRAAMREEALLLGEFEDLKKPGSELFKRTTRILRENGVDEKSVGDHRMLRLAAKAAQAEIDAEKASSKGKQERIAAQGPSGRRVSGDAPMISEETRRFAEKMGIKDMSRVAREASRMGKL